MEDRENKEFKYIFIGCNRSGLAAMTHKIINASKHDKILIVGNKPVEDKNDTDILKDYLKKNLIIPFDAR